MNILIDNGLSFIFDMNFNNEKCFDKVRDYNVVKIKLDSTDNENIKSIMLRKYEPNKIIEGVLGDNTEYESSYDEKTYYEIKKRKEITLDDSYFDYLIIKDELLNDKINDIVNGIEKRFS